MAYSAADVKKLREETGAGVLDCKKALDETNGNYDKARQIVLEKGLARAEKKSDRETGVGYIASYVHANNQIAALVEIRCETDFVARNSDFQAMAKDVAMQIVAMNPETVEELLTQETLRDGAHTIDQLVKSVSGKIGEKFEIKRFVRYQVGE